LHPLDHDIPSVRVATQLQIVLSQLWSVRHTWRMWAHNGTGDDMSIAVLSTNRPHLPRQVRLEWDPVRERQMLLAPEGVLVLNQTGAAILGLCDGERTVVEIVEELRGQYNRVADDEVRDFLARLVAKRLVGLGDE
jgi:pyrroloquinoline quinone biosynthesis protein D